MSFIRKAGSIFRRAITNHTAFNGSASMPAIYQALRHMSSSRIFVGGIPYGMDDQSLREAFTGFGDVIEARIILDRETGKSRGFGFVSFSSSEEATAAISMDGKNLEGRIIHVDYATERTGGFRSSGGGYGQNDGFGSGGGYSRNDGFGSGGGYSQNDGFGSGGGYSQNDGFGNGGYSQNDGFGSGYGGRFDRGSEENLDGESGERFNEGSSDLGGGYGGSNTSGSRDEYGDEDEPRNDICNTGRGY